MQQDSDSQAQQKIYNRPPENERNKVLQWHSQSLDLNAVVHKQTTANLNELKHCCEEEGAKIPPKQQLFQVLKVVLQDTKS